MARGARGHRRAPRLGAARRGRRRPGRSPATCEPLAHACDDHARHAHLPAPGDPLAADPTGHERHPAAARPAVACHRDRVHGQQPAPGAGRRGRSRVCRPAGGVGTLYDGPRLDRSGALVRRVDAGGSVHAGARRSLVPAPRDDRRRAAFRARDGGRRAVRGNPDRRPVRGAPSRTMDRAARPRRARRASGAPRRPRHPPRPGTRHGRSSCGS